MLYTLGDLAFIDSLDAAGRGSITAFLRGASYVWGDLVPKGSSEGLLIGLTSVDRATFQDLPSNTGILEDFPADVWGGL